VNAELEDPVMDGRTAIPVSVNDLLGTATQGIQNGLARAAESASQVARSTSAEPADLAGAAVGMLEARAQVEASAAIVRSADRMLGSLLDVFA